ncbi:RHS repeat domain-containing protein [Streptomyces sp. NPDC001774]
MGKKGQELTARTVTTSEHDGHGEVTSTATAWAEGARPEGDAGPEQVTETRTVEVDTGKHTRTDTVTTPAGTATEVTDLATGQVIATTDTAGRTAKTEYDAAGRPVKQTAPDGLVTTTAYTPTSTTVAGPDGHVTVETTDLLGRVVKQTDNIRDGKITDDPAARVLQSVEYSRDGLSATVTDGAGRTTTTTNDVLGRPVKTVAPNGMTQLTAYSDAATAQTSTKTTAVLPAGESDPGKAVAVTTETFDSAERPVASASSFADKTPTTPTSQVFDGLGRVKESMSGDVTTTPSYDGPGGTQRMATLTPQNPGAFPGTKVTAGTRDDLTGAPTVKTLTPGQGAEGGRSGITVVRDGAGRIVAETDQNGQKTTYTYTPGGQVRESVSPSGVKTAFTYEEKTGRVTEVAVTSADGKSTEKTGYTYAPRTGRVTGVFDPDDKAGTLISYSYDADGNVTKVAYPDGKTVRQAFGNHGQRTSLTDITGAKTVYTYNGDGTLKEAVQREGVTEDGPVKASIAYTYDGLGRITEAVRGSEGGGKGVTTAYAYTGASQIRTEKTSRPDGTVITKADYTYDSHGNLTHRTDTRPGITTEDGDGGSGGAVGPMVKTSTGYRYDAYNRLLGSETKDEAGTLLSSAAYTINVSGDVTRTDTAGPDGKKTTTSHTIDPAGRLTAVTTGSKTTAQTWDSEGNLLTDHQGSVYTYNTRNQPVTVTTKGGTTTRYTYWADGTRATTTDGDDGGTTRFHYTPDGDIANDTYTTSDGGAGASQSITASYLLGATREARTLTGEDAAGAAATGGGYLLHDRHGSTTALTTADGTVNAAWHYTDYGQAAGHTGTAVASSATGRGPGANPFTYAGEYTNPETGTQYLKTRTYDPATKRFTTRDPASLHNRYQAFDTNPIMRVDPAGHAAIEDWVAFGITAAFTLAAIIATILAPPAGPAIVIAIAGYFAETAGLALQTVALADASAKFLSPKARDGIFWAGFGAGIAGALTGIGAAAATRFGAGIARGGAKTAPSIEIELKEASEIFTGLVDSDSSEYAKAVMKDFNSIPREHLELVATHMRNEMATGNHHSAGIFIRDSPYPTHLIDMPKHRGLYFAAMRNNDSPFYSNYYSALMLPTLNSLPDFRIPASKIHLHEFAHAYADAAKKSGKGHLFASYPTEKIQNAVREAHAGKRTALREWDYFMQNEEFWADAYAAHYGGLKLGNSDAATALNSEFFLSQ